MNIEAKKMLRQKRKWRIRKKVSGTAERPRVTVHFSNKHIYAQAVNDDAGVTLAFLSSLDSELRGQKLAANVASARTLGTAFAVKARAAGIDRVVFDRNGRPFHGKVKQFADAAREGGLLF